MSAIVTSRIMMASAGSSELGVVDRQTMHWRSAPSKSQPALLVAQICTSNESPAIEGKCHFYLFTIEHPLVSFERGSCIQPRSALLQPIRHTPRLRKHHTRQRLPLPAQKRLQEFPVFRPPRQIHRRQPQTRREDRQRHCRLNSIHFLYQENRFDQAASGSSQMRGDLALDQAPCDCLAVDGSCGLESLVVMLVFHVYTFGIFKRAGRKAGGGLSDAFFRRGQEEINGHVD